MLALTGRIGDVFYVGDVKIIIGNNRQGKIKLVFDAPPDVPINRENVYLDKVAAGILRPRTPTDRKN